MNTNRSLTSSIKIVGNFWGFFRCCECQGVKNPLRLLMIHSVIMKKVSDEHQAIICFIDFSLGSMLNAKMLIAGKYF